MTQSLWTKTARTPSRAPLSGDLSADTVVIGGGLCGILTAYYLKQRGIEAVVLEAGRLGSGQTKNTTAKLTAQHGLIYDRLKQQFSPHLAQQYGDANQQAIRDYWALTEDLGIDCAMEERPAYLYTQGDPIPLRREAESARNLGLPASFTTETGLPFPVSGAVRFEGQAQFHPLKFLFALAEHVTVYEQTRVQKVEGGLVTTNRGSLRANHVVFATHYPFPLVPGLYFARMHQERSYVLALEGIKPPHGMYLGVEAEGLSIRSYGDYLLLGGGGHRTGENRPGGKYDFLRQQAAALFPGHRETAHWSAQDCMTLDGVPYIGPYASDAPGWYVATGFGKWGMTTSMAAAHILSDQIAGRESPFGDVFSPQRFVPSASMGNLLSDGLHAMGDLSREFFAPPRADLDALPPGHGGVVAYEGRKAGVYKEEDGTLHIVSTRCPHLGCQVEWNSDERTWDCPCHGSRFTMDGHLLDGPAQTGLERPAHE